VPAWATHSVFVGGLEPRFKAMSIYRQSDPDLSRLVTTQLAGDLFLSASLYFSIEALIEIGCVVTSLVVGWLVVTRVHCGQTVHPRPIVTMEH